ncbi:MAG: sensor histidine kinase [Lachnospiraceae bacterium]
MRNALFYGRQFFIQLYRRCSRMRFSRYSLRKRISIFSFALIFVLSISLIFSYYIYYNSLLNNTYKNLSESLNLYCDQLSDDFDSVEDTLYTYSVSNTDVGLLTTLNSPSDTITYRIRVHQLLNNTIPYLSNIDGLFIYAPRTDSYVSSFHINTSSQFNEYVKSLARSDFREFEGITGYTTDWFFVTHDSDVFLLRIIKTPYSVMGAWTNVDKLTASLKEMSILDADYLFMSEDGQIYSGAGWSSDSLPGFSSDFQVITDNSRQKFLQISSKLNFSSFYLTMLIPDSTIQSALMPLYRSYLILLIIVVIFLVLLSLSVSRFLNKPLSALRTASEQVQNGYEISLAKSQERCIEVLEIESAIQYLYDEISGLKINIYEARIAKTEFELQYLKSQVAPHFLINCLATIPSIQSAENGGELLQKMIRTLSEHLRYTLSSNDMVSVSTELYYVKNYIELTQIRFPDSLRFCLDMDSDCQTASICPLLILMLTENTIKYNIVMGEILKLKINGDIEYEGDKKRIHITHIDSGDGFSDTILDKLNHFEKLQAEQITGNKIGLYNILKRTILLYGESARVIFSNEPGWGARIDILLPYLEYPGIIRTKG